MIWSGWLLSKRRALMKRKPDPDQVCLRCRQVPAAQFLDLSQGLLFAVCKTCFDEAKAALKKLKT